MNTLRFSVKRYIYSSSLSKYSSVLNCTHEFHSSNNNNNNHQQNNWNKNIKLSASFLSCCSLFGIFIVNQIQKEKINSFSYKTAYCATESDSSSIKNDYEKLPIFKREEISKHKNPKESVWITYKDKVYDVTTFINQHPGGTKILLAAGGAVDPFWEIYAVHKTEEVQKILNEYLIGRLHPDDVEAQKKALSLTSDANDPFANDPLRHPLLKIVSSKPFNAETPLELINDHPFTPNDLFFVRNHLPVPLIDDKTYQLSVEGPENILKRSLKFRVDELKKRFPSHCIDATVMCSGNRRSDMGEHKAVRGLAWTAGAISNARWTGVRLRQLLSWCLMISEEQLTAEWCLKNGIRHVQFEGMDKDESGSPYGASVPVEIALDPTVEALVVYEMNGEPLSLDHGYPLRIIVPGLVGARQVKWLRKINLSDKESSSFWQQKDYKTFSPSADVNQLNYEKSPAIMESPVQSAICWPSNHSIVSVDEDDSITVKGYAWSGGGRGIIRVEVSTDEGESWYAAKLFPVESNPAHSTADVDGVNPTEIPLRGQWAWTLWEVDIPLTLSEGKSSQNLHILCKATDTSQNSQPDSYKGTWNVRGLLANAWHGIQVTVTDNNNND